MTSRASAGAMFDYIARAHSRKWSVVVADPHGDDCPHRHLMRLVDILPPTAPLLIVAHSYGAAMSLGMLKASYASIQGRLKAIALTDGIETCIVACGTRASVRVLNGTLFG